MNEPADPSPMESRLRGLMYQFVSLYERWSEDRQAAAQQGADTAELVKQFTEQVATFRDLEPKVRQQLIASTQEGVRNIAQEVGQTIGKEATQATEPAISFLYDAARQAEQTLARYRKEIVVSRWYTIGVAICTGFFASMLTGFWVDSRIPAPTSPLNDQQIHYLGIGKTLEEVWPEMSDKEKKRWKELLQFNPSPKK